MDHLADEQWKQLDPMQVLTQKKSRMIIQYEIPFFENIAVPTKDNLIL